MEFLFPLVYRDQSGIKEIDYTRGKKGDEACILRR